MTPHNHRAYVPGCFRCELGRDEAYDIALQELRELRELVDEVASAGVVSDDPRIGYVEVQINRVTWEALQDA